MDGMDGMDLGFDIVDDWSNIISCSKITSGVLMNGIEVDRSNI